MFLIGLLIDLPALAIVIPGNLFTLSLTTCFLLFFLVIYLGESLVPPFTYFLVG